MAKKPIEGRLFQIAWSGHTNPPDGAPRVLCEVFTLSHTPPAEFTQFEVSLGGGYALYSCHIAPPPKQLPEASLATVRKKRLTRRLTAKVPMFAEQFAAEEMAQKPDYYNGLTDAHLQTVKDDLLTREWARYEELLGRIDQVIVFAQEPQACKEKAARLKAEMLEIQQRARQKQADQTPDQTPIRPPFQPL